MRKIVKLSCIFAAGFFLIYSAVANIRSFAGETPKIMGLLAFTAEDIEAAGIPLVAPPKVTFISTHQGVMENEGVISVTVNLSKAHKWNVTIPFTVSGTATEGIDYNITESPLVIEAGDMSADILIDINDDTRAEENESVTITLDFDHAINAAPGAITEHTARIYDNDIVVPTKPREKLKPTFRPY